jgi:hypothetical protein
MSLNVWRIRGDVSWDGRINLSDITLLIAYVYMNGAPPKPIVSIGDVDCDGKINLSDITLVIAYVYQHGAPPCD